jgi:arylsulfatase A-like enzyme
LWPAGIANPGRTISDMVSFIDFAPTFLECAGVRPEQTGMAAMSGRSLMNIFQSEGDGSVDPTRDHVLIGKERHDVGRPGDVGYPIRGMFKGEYLYLRNFEVDRWPAGNPETGYMNSDGGPTKTEILKLRNDPTGGKYWEWSFGKRPAEELYDVEKDPDCLRNLAADPALASIRESMANELHQRLLQQEDPRITGKGGPLDENPVANPAVRQFHERFSNGELGPARWINASDIQEP